MSHIDTSPKRANEPLFWVMFGAGGMLSAFLLPILVLFTGILVPLGIISPDAMSYERVSAFADSWYGVLILLAVIALPMWLAMHRIFHGLHDIGVHHQRHLQQVFFYGIAFMVTVAAATLLLVI